tara:strand:- start:5990 stop:6838 length:849 start_codon:yes stop_codon:yes gene_type:complete
MKIICVSSIHKEGLEKYGDIFIKSFEENFPNECDLYIYTENCKPKFNRKNIFTVDIFEKCGYDKINNFKNYFNNKDYLNQKKNIYDKVTKKYGINHATDIYAWNCKVSSYLHCIKNYSNGYDFLIWLDFDLYFINKLSFTKLLNIIKYKDKYTYISSLQSSSNIFSSDIRLETGFLVFNLKHHIHTTFIEDYEKKWYLPTKYLFKLENPTDDCFLKYFIDNYCKDKNIKFNNLGCLYTSIKESEKIKNKQILLNDNNLLNYYIRHLTGNYNDKIRKYNNIKI